jgi:hypothetical protein
MGHTRQEPPVAKKSVNGKPVRAATTARTGSASSLRSSKNGGTRGKKPALPRTAAGASPAASSRAAKPRVSRKGAAKLAGQVLPAGWDAKRLADEVTHLDVVYVEAAQTGEIGRVLGSRGLQMAGGAVLVISRPPQASAKARPLRDTLLAESRTLPSTLKSSALAAYRSALDRVRDDAAFWIEANDLAKALGSRSSNAPDFLKRKRDSGQLASATSGRRHVYPAVVLSNRHVGLHPWLSGFHAGLPESKRGWPLMIWLHTPSAALDGRAPYQVLAEHDLPGAKLERHAARYRAGLEA